MAAFNIEIQGLTQFLVRLDQLSDGIVEATAEGVKEAALDVETKAKEACPVRSGELRRSIETVIENGDGITATIGTNKEYAPYVEYGTGLFAPDGRKDVPWNYQDSEGNWHSTCGQPPQPFLIPSFNGDIICGIIEDKIREAVNNG